MLMKYPFLLGLFPHASQSVNEYPDVMPKGGSTSPKPRRSRKARQVTIRRQIHHALVIEDRAIQCICDFLLEEYPKSHLSIEAICEGGLSIQARTLKELVDHSFTADTIIGLELRIVNSDGHGCALLLEDRRSNSASFTISDVNSPHANLVASELERILRRLRPLWSVLTYNTAMLLALSVVISLLAATCSSFAPSPLKCAWGQNISALPVTLLVLLALCRSLASLWEWLLPKVCVLLASQRERFALRTILRNFMLVSCIGAASKTVVALLVDRW